MSEKSGFGERTEQWFLDGPAEVKTEPLVLPIAVLDWLDELGNRGLFVQDSFGDRALAPGAAELFRALNVVLAGGEVSVQVQLPPDDTTKHALDRKLAAAMAAMMGKSA